MAEEPARRDPADASGSESPPPISATSRPRRRAPLTTIAVLIAVLAVCLGLWYAFARLGTNAMIDLTDSYEGTAQLPAIDHVGWVAGGRYLVVQSRDEDGEPAVFVLDPETGAERVRSGYVFVTGEPSSARIWLVPTTAEELRSRAESVAPAPHYGPYDWPPERLLVWDLDGDGGPADDAEARWRAVPGPGDWVAYYEIDVLKGVFPSRVLFNDSASHGEGHRAQLPPDIATYLPCGWSASGEYLALMGLVKPPDTRVGAEGQEPVTRLLVVRAEDGTVTADVQVVGAAAPMWLPSTDVLVWPEYGGRTTSAPGSLGGTAAVRLMALRPGGTPAPVGEVLGWRLPQEFESARVIEPLGSVETGVVLEVGTDAGSELWLVGEGGLDHIGGLAPVLSADLSPSGTLAVLSYGLRADGDTSYCRHVVRLYDQRGGSRRDLWQGPEQVEEWCMD